MIDAAPDMIEHAPAHLYDLMIPLRATVLDAHLGPHGPIDAGLSGRACTSCRLTDEPGTGPSAADGPMVAPYWSLPFPAESFDCVVLHGVLDRRLRRAPGAAEPHPGVALLRAVHRILRPGGMIAVAAHNALALGDGRARQHHVAGAADRPLAARTYRGYVAQLRRAGFEPAASFAVMPSYEEPARIVSTAAVAARPFYASTPIFGHGWSALGQRVGRRVLNALNVLPYVQQSFLIVGRRC